MFAYTRNERKWIRETTPQPPSQYQVQESILFYIIFYAVGFGHKVPFNGFFCKSTYFVRGVQVLDLVYSLNL